MHRTNHFRRVGTIAVSGLLVVGLTTPVNAPAIGASAAEPEQESRVPAPEQVGPVPVRPFTPPASGSDTDAASAQRRTARTSWPRAGSAQVTLAADGRSALRAGSLPVRIASTGGRVGMPARVQVSVRPLGSRLAIGLRRTDGRTEPGRVRVEVDYSGFADAYGGDWAARLQIVPSRKEQVRALRNDLSSHTITADVHVNGDYVLQAPPEGSTGDYKATSLSPSGTWQVNTQGGDFSWSYPLRTPPVPGGLAPELGLSYSSGGADGRTASTNNQTSWIGEGWSLWPGFIERSYQGCAEDRSGNNTGTQKPGDLCWETENATLSFGEQSGRLVPAGAGVWRPEDDDGTRVQQFFRPDPAINGDNDGEYWKVTTTDGTQYFFGQNRLPGWTNNTDTPTTQSAWTVPVYGNDPGEDCTKPTFAASACIQAYRWNLDYVVDPHGNSMSYFYTAENNRYSQNLGAATALYTRGGVLSRIEYGTRAGREYTTQAPARVVFTPANRCATGQNCALHNASAWPDVPWEADCLTTSCAGKVSPSFWTTNRLGSITTQISTGNGAYRNIDRWDLAHSYPPPGDGLTGALWLDSLTHIGLVGAATALPPVRFAGALQPNRVDSDPDGLPALNKMRISAITSESGGAVNVEYRTECNPGALPAARDKNTKLCFPVRWVPPQGPEPIDDWFHKYVVTRTTEQDKVTDARSIVTNYDYPFDPADPTAGGAWAYDDNPLTPLKYRTWSQWRGFQKVTVRRGDPRQDGTKESRSSFRYFRGLHGDRLEAGGTKSVTVVDSTNKPWDDLPALAGFTREQITYDGAAEVRGVINDPSVRPTGSHLTLRSNQVETVRSVTRDRLSGGGVRTTQVDTSYDEYGNPTRVNDLADIGKGDDDRCTTTTYVPNPTAMLVTLPSRETVVGVACGATPAFPADAISDTKTSYDHQGHGVAPIKGNATQVETAKDYTGSTPVWLTTNTSTYDDFGRVLESKDALRRPSTTAYTQTHGLTTRTTQTNALEHLSTTELDPAWGLPAKETDPSLRVTALTYDGLGRLTKVWKPGRTEAGGDSPHLQFAYGVRNSGGPNWVRTQTLKANGNQVATLTLLDGFLRERQTQAPSPQGGRILTDTLYDSRGLATVKRAPFYDNTAGPGTTLQVVTDGGAVPGATVTVYDGAERPIHEIYTEKNIEQWRTTTIYGGTNVTVIPPPGGTMTTAWSDARDRTIALVQYHGHGEAALTGPNDVTLYGYTKRGDLNKIVDPTNNVWRYTYDVLGRKRTADDPDKGVSMMAYDDAGQLLSTKDARGKTLIASYDDLGRKTETRLGSATGPVLTRHVYDTTDKGMLGSATRYVGGEGGAAYVRSITGYDEAGRPKGEVVTLPATEGKLAEKPYATTFAYLADGSPRATTLPALGDLTEETLSHGYDQLGLPDKLTGKLTYITDIEYTALAETAQLELGPEGNELWRSSYYEFGTRRLSEVLTTKLAWDGAFVHDFDYRYDPAGNVIRIGDRSAGTAFDVQCFQHDYLRRTTAAWTAVDPADACTTAPTASRVGGPAPYWQEFGYDPIGNRKTRTVKGLGGAADVISTYTYPPPRDGVDRPHAVTSVQTGSTTASYGYDDAGNTIRRPGQSVNWDDEGLLASIDTSSGSTSYVYDADGNVLLRRDPGRSTLFVGNGELTLDTASLALRGTRYYDGIGTRTAAGFVWTAADHHGTSSAAIDATTLTPTPRRFDLFGNPRGAAVAWPAGDRAFAGGAANAATGLTRLGAREYDPALGKFLSVDPVIDPNDPQQMNAYAYSNNNPSTMTDPDGLKYFEGDSGGGVDAGVYHGKRPKKTFKKTTNHCSKKCRKWSEDHKRRVAKKKREKAKAFTARMKYGRKNRQRLVNHIPEPTPISDMMENLFPLGPFQSASVCVDVAAAFAYAVGANNCVNVDAKGVTLSSSTKWGQAVAGGASVGIGPKLNTKDADSVSKGRGRAVETSVGVPVFPFVSASGGISAEPDLDSMSVFVRLGLGVGVNYGGVYETNGLNSGYVTTWEAADSFLGDMTGLW